MGHTFTIIYLPFIYQTYFFYESDLARVAAVYTHM